MNNYSINTVQNISIDHSFASIGERIGAVLIDFIILGSYGLVISLFISILADQVLLSFILVLPVLFYNFMFEIFMNGQSPGKKVMNIKVVSENGSNPSFVSYFLRWVFRLIDIALLFGSVATLSILITNKKQRLGDMSAGTILIRTGRKLKTKSIYVQLPENYKPTFQGLTMLKEKDIYTVKEVIDFLNKDNESGDARTFALKTKESLELKLGIKSDLRALEFLQTIMKDYNFEKVSKL